MVSQCIQKLCLYYTVVYQVCSSILFRKINVHIFIKNYFIAKKCWPSFEPSENHNLFAVGSSCLDIDGCWLCQGNGCWRLGWLWQLLQTTLKFATLMTLSFMNDFSAVCTSAVGAYFTYRTAFKIRVSPLKPCNCSMN